jgi:glc operon protein GlcG
VTTNLFVVLSLAVAIAAAPRGLSAQGQPAGQAQAPRSTGIDLATAKRMMAAAEAQAKAQGTSGAIAIVDAVNGDLVSFLRLDGATHVAVISAEGKARAALLFGVSTKEIRASLDSGKPLSARPTTPSAYGEFNRLVNISTNQGGMLVMRDGKIVAAVGVGGAGGGDRDDAVAQAAVNAASAR